MDAQQAAPDNAVLRIRTFEKVRKPMFQECGEWNVIVRQVNPGGKKVSQHAQKKAVEVEELREVLFWRTDVATARRRDTPGG
jgi:hypothetical protein